MKDRSPRLVLCTGIGYAEQFRSAFSSGDEELKAEKVAGKLMRYFVVNSGATLVAIVYFLGGRYGLKSDDELGATGRRLRELLQQMPNKPIHATREDARA